MYWVRLDIIPCQCHACFELIVKQVKSKVHTFFTVVLEWKLIHISLNRLSNKALTANPQIAGRPARQKSAPRARALKISVPRRIPPSTAMGILPFATGTISRRTSRVEGTLSSWRPPWFEITIPSKPYFMASSASPEV